jgi:hypothetical protein
VQSGFNLYLVRVWMTCPPEDEIKELSSSGWVN